MIKDDLNFAKLITATLVYGRVDLERSFIKHSGVDYVIVRGYRHGEDHSFNRGVLDHRVHGTYKNKLIKQGTMKVLQVDGWCRGTHTVITRDYAENLANSLVDERSNPFKGLSLKGSSHSLTGIDLETISPAELAWIWENIDQLNIKKSTTYHYGVPSSYRIVEILQDKDDKKARNFKNLTKLNRVPSKLLEVIGGGHAARAMKEHDYKSYDMRAFVENESIEEIKRSLEKVYEANAIRISDAKKKGFVLKAALRDIKMFSEKRLEKRLIEKACLWAADSDKDVQEFCRAVLEGE